MIVGYARVSTVEQHEDRQVIALKEAGCEKIFLDKLSGKNTQRPQLQAMIDFTREGDTVIVSEYNRLARSTKDLLDIIGKLNGQGVGVVSQKESLDTSTPQGKFMLTVFAGMAEFERAIILQRQAEGIAVAKAKGKYKGRKRKQKPQNWQDLYQKYRMREMTAVELAKECNVSRSLVHQWIRAEKRAAPEGATLS